MVVSHCVTTALLFSASRFLSLKQSFSQSEWIDTTLKGGLQMMESFNRLVFWLILNGGYIYIYLYSLKRTYRYVWVAFPQPGFKTVGHCLIVFLVVMIAGILDDTLPMHPTILQRNFAMAGRYFMYTSTTRTLIDCFCKWWSCHWFVSLEYSGKTIRWGSLSMKNIKASQVK